MHGGGEGGEGEAEEEEETLERAGEGFDLSGGEGGGEEREEGVKHLQLLFGFGVEFPSLEGSLEELDGGRE